MKGAFSGLGGSGKMVQTHLQPSPLPRADGMAHSLWAGLFVSSDYLGCCPDTERLLGLPVNRNRLEARQRFRQRFIGGPAVSGGGGNGRSPCSSLPRGGSGFRLWGGVGVSRGCAGSGGLLALQ